MLPMNCVTSGVFAVLVRRVIPVCGFTIFQYPVLQQPLSCRLLDCV